MYQEEGGRTRDASGNWIDSGAVPGNKYEPGLGGEYNSGGRTRDDNG